MKPRFEVCIDGSTLAIVLDENAAEKLAEIRMIAVLNQDQAYEAWGSLRAGSAVAGWQSRGRVAGDAYMTGEGVALALVQPFVLSDSGL